MDKIESSESKKWRKRGNEYYKSIDADLSPVIKKPRLENALQCYQKAFDTGLDDEEKSSAAKNIGLTTWKQFKKAGTDVTPELLVHHCREALKHFSYAHRSGKASKPQEWVNGIQDSALSCLKDAIEALKLTLDMDKRCKELHSLVQSIEIDMVKSECYFYLATCHFHRGILAMEKSEYKTCLSAMRECYMPIEEAGRLTSQETLRKQVQDLEKDVQVTQCMAESIQARVNGDELYEKIVKDTETWNIDMVLGVIDWYKEASRHTQGLTEVELEAIAVSRLGRVYDKLLLMKERAKKYYMHSIELAHSVSPRTFGTKEWYKEARDAVDKYQAETVKSEDEQASRDKAAILKELESEMKQLNDWKTKSNTEFLTELYKTFPPKKAEQKLVMPNFQDTDWHIKMKKALQQAVVHYHPDMVDVDKHGKKWKVLCEEITKFCTNRYERRKGTT